MRVLLNPEGPWLRSGNLPNWRRGRGVGSAPENGQRVGMSFQAPEVGKFGTDPAAGGEKGEQTRQAARATYCNSWWRPHRAEIRRGIALFLSCCHLQGFLLLTREQ